MKVPCGISLDENIYQVFVNHPHLKRSQWINDLVKQEMIAKGMLKVEA